MTSTQKNELRLLHLRLDAELRDPIDTAKVASTIGSMWQVVEDVLAALDDNQLQVVEKSES